MQKFYLGTYFDPETGQKLDIQSLSSNYEHAVQKFYEDMSELHITDSSYIDGSTADQIDDLNQSGCDMVLTNDRELKQLIQLFQH